jgi:hypothetical protein
MEDRRSACVNALPSGRPWLDHNCATRSRCMPFTSSVVASLYRCEAVRMCACHGLEWGGRKRRNCKPQTKRCKNSFSLGTSSPRA